MEILFGGGPNVLLADYAHSARLFHAFDHYRLNELRFSVSTDSDRRRALELTRLPSLVK